MKHTPTPTPYAYRMEGDSMAIIFHQTPTGEQRITRTASVLGEANAAFITHACNAHEALVAALEDAVERLARVDAELLRATGQPFEYEIGEILRGRAALKLAKGE